MAPQRVGSRTVWEHDGDDKSSRNAQHARLRYAAGLRAAAVDMAVLFTGAEHVVRVDFVERLERWFFPFVAGVVGTDAKIEPRPIHRHPAVHRVFSVAELKRRIVLHRHRPRVCVWVR
jgi:hypothetical protein